MAMGTRLCKTRALSHPLPRLLGAVRVRRGYMPPAVKDREDALLPHESGVCCCLLLLPVPSHTSTALASAASKLRAATSALANTVPPVESDDDTPLREALAAADAASQAAEERDAQRLRAQVEDLNMQVSRLRKHLRGSERRATSMQERAIRAEEEGHKAQAALAKERSARLDLLCVRVGAVRAKPTTAQPH